MRDFNMKTSLEGRSYNLKKNTKILNTSENCIKATEKVNYSDKTY